MIESHDLVWTDCETFTPCEPADIPVFPQGVEEEEEAEHYSDEEAPAAGSESKPSAADGPTKIEEGDEEAEGEGGGPSKEESKAEEKGNLAGERQSGDGQVRLFLHLDDIIC